MYSHQSVAHHMISTAYIIIIPLLSVRRETEHLNLGQTHNINNNMERILYKRKKTFA